MKKIAFLTGMAAILASNAYAAIDLSTFSLDMTPLETLIPIILGAGATVWVGRKLVKFVNKS